MRRLHQFALCLTLPAASWLSGCGHTFETTTPLPAVPTPYRVSDLSDLAFLSGRWATIPEPGTQDVTTEVWSRFDDDLMLGSNFSLRGTAMRGFESLAIRRDRETDIVHYIAAPGGREPGTAFELIESGAGHAVFENLAHDFPNRIIYRLDPETGRLHASIEGVGEGAEQRIEWVFQRAE